MKDYSYSLQKKSTYNPVLAPVMYIFFWDCLLACKAFYCTGKRISDSKFNWILISSKNWTPLTEFHKIIQVWYDSQKTKKQQPRNVCAYNDNAHYSCLNFKLPGFRNCLKTLAPSVKGRGNMEIIKGFLILKYHLSLKDSDD